MTEPATAQPAPHPAASQPAPAPGLIDRLTNAIHSQSEPSPSASPGLDLTGLAKAATPALALAARRLPLGVLILGGVAAGVALTNPRVRDRVKATAEKGLAALRR